MKKERYYLIDLFKFLAAICIVMIHTIATGGREGIIYTFLGEVIYGIPVPFFFVCSGFLLGEKIIVKKSNVKETVKNYVKRLIIPLIFWCLISSFFVFDFSKALSVSFWLDFFQKFFFSSWCAMWYVMGLIVAIILMYPFIKRGKYRLLITIGIILFFIGLLSGNYYFIIKDTFMESVFSSYDKIFLTTRNGLFYGLPFVSFGFYLAYYKSIKEINYSHVLVTIIISFIVLVAEAFLLENKISGETSNMYISTIVLIPMLVLYLSKYKKEKPDWSSLGKYSVGIYFTHQFINYVYKYFTNLVGIKLFFVVLITSFVLLFVLYKINNKYINKIIS